MNIRRVLVVIACAAALLAGQSVLRAQDRERSVWDGVYTEAQARRGLSLYNQHCLDCHGDDLEGDGEESPALKGQAFLANWDGQKLGDFYTRIKRDMAWPKFGNLSPPVVADLVAYLLSINRFPPGSVELPHAVEVLNEIRFEVRRPEKKR